MPGLRLSSVSSPVGSFFLLERGAQALMVTAAVESIWEKLGHRLPLEDCETELASRLSSGFSTGDFSLPFAWDYVRPNFERRVLELLCEVRSGETTSYGELARQAGSPSAARAVGGAMRKNPLVLVVPCHRVLPTTGKVGHYSAGGPQVKSWLLALEKGRRERALAGGRSPTFSAASVQ